jgi:hypothetical protein
MHANPPSSPPPATPRTVRAPVKRQTVEPPEPEVQHAHAPSAERVAMRVALVKAPAPEEKPFECQKDRMEGIKGIMEFGGLTSELAQEPVLDGKKASQARQQAEGSLPKEHTKGAHGGLLGSPRNKVALRTRVGKGRGTHAIGVGGAMNEQGYLEASLFETSLHLDEDDRDNLPRLDQEQEASRIPITAPKAPVAARQHNDVCAWVPGFADVRQEPGDFS